MRRVRERGQVQQHERQLERPPRAIPHGIRRRDRGVQLQRRVLAARLGRDRVDPLLPHRVIGEPKRGRHIRVGQRCDSGSHPPERDPRDIEVVARLLSVRSETLPMARRSAPPAQRSMPHRRPRAARASPEASPPLASLSVFMSSAAWAAVNGSRTAGSAKSSGPGASVRGTSCAGIASVRSRTARVRIVGRLSHHDADAMPDRELDR